MTIKALLNQVKAMERKLPAPQEQLHTGPEWQVLRTLLLHESAPFPDGQCRIREAIERVEHMGRRWSWDTAQDVLFEAVKPYMDARVAIAEALTEESARRGDPLAIRALETRRRAEALSQMETPS